MKNQLDKLSVNKNLKIVIFVLYDIAALAFSWIVSILIAEYDFASCFKNSVWFLIAGLALVVLVNLVLGLYSKLWKYAGFADALKIFCSALVIALYTVLVANLSKQVELGVKWCIIVVFIYLNMLVGSRFLYRLCSLFINKVRSGHNLNENKKVMIIGAGEAGAKLLEEIYKNDLKMQPVCFIDDDRNKLGQEIGNVKIVGTTDEICKYAEQYGVQPIIVAIPSASTAMVLNCFCIASRQPSGYSSIPDAVVMESLS